MVINIFPKLYVTFCCSEKILHKWQFCLAKVLRYHVLNKTALITTSTQALCLIKPSGTLTSRLSSATVVDKFDTSCVMLVSCAWSNWMASVCRWSIHMKTVFVFWLQQGRWQEPSVHLLKVESVLVWLYWAILTSECLANKTQLPQEGGLPFCLPWEKIQFPFQGLFADCLYQNCRLSSESKAVTGTGGQYEDKVVRRVAELRSELKGSNFLSRILCSWCPHWAKSASYSARTCSANP